MRALAASRPQARMLGWRMSQEPENHETASEPTVAEMRADLIEAGYEETLARFMRHYPNIPEAKAVEMFHAVY